jgi:hypothetical protein
MTAIRIILRVLFETAVLSPACGAAQAACQGKIVSGTAISGKTSYDPFAAGGISELYAIGIMNTGNQSCVYALAFTASSMPAKLGATLSYTLTNLNGQAVMSAGAASGGSYPASAQSAPVSVNGRYDLLFTIVIEPGRFAAPGTYANSVNVSAQLYGIESGLAALLHTVPVSITNAVRETFSVNIAGTGPATTVDFGALTTNAQKAVLIRARAAISDTIWLSALIIRGRCC